MPFLFICTSITYTRFTVKKKKTLARHTDMSESRPKEPTSPQFMVLLMIINEWIRQTETRLTD